MSTVHIITEPSTEPVTADEALAQTGAEDTQANRSTLEALIAAAREDVEAYTRRALITQQRELTLDRLPGNGWLGFEALARTKAPPGSWVPLPGGRLQSVDTVKLYDEDENATVVDSSVYHVDTSNEPGRLQLRSGQEWPILAYPAPTGGARITYTCGYGDGAANVPRLIRQAILATVAAFYGHPDPTVMQEQVSKALTMFVRGDGQLPPEVRAMLQPYRLLRGVT